MNLFSWFCFIHQLLARDILKIWSYIADNFSSFSQNNVYMKKINLAWNGFGLEGSIAFGDALKGNQVLEELDLTYV